MTRRTTLLAGSTLVAVILLAGVAFGISRRDKGGSTPAVPNEAASLFQSAATRQTATDKEIDTVLSYLTKRDNDPVILARLASAYLQKVRETGDPTYYGKAENALRRSLERSPNNGDALLGMGSLALARHQFTEALDWGHKAVAVNPYRAATYGVVADALVELGRYDEAVDAVQKMVDTRPDLSSYSRVAFLRDLHGDVPGAIEAMTRAVGAGAGAAENTAYVRVQLGNLYFNSGRLDDAEREYRITLERTPGYGPAQAGLAYVLAARGQDAAAAPLFSKAVEAFPVAEYVIALGDLYTRMNRPGDAAKQYDLARVLERLQVANGTDVDIETALFDADHGADPEATVARAREGYVRRPSIHGADVLAWSLYKAGRPAEAQPYAAEALKLGTRDALKLYHAGMIAHALGKNAEARDLLSHAVATNPHFSILHSAEAAATLAALGGPLPVAAGVVRGQ